MLVESTFVSIVLQFITALVDIYGLKLPVGDNYTILKDILRVELFVQIVELIFYIWLIFSIHSVKNITIFRYADWFITTPLMLITLMAYLTIDHEKNLKLVDFLKTHKKNIIIVVILNMLMLGFGFISELFPSVQIPLVILGFVPFAMYFYLIWKEYLNREQPDVHPVFTRKWIYWYFVIIWSLYGVAALMPYIAKNTALNILDLFSKNAFGIMLVYIISHHNIVNNNNNNLMKNE